MKKAILSISIIISSVLVFSQQYNDKILDAMQSELKRNVEQLKLESLQSPFYIAYTLGDSELTYIGATLGSITNSNSERFRSQNTDLLVGSYQRANNNYIDANILYQRPTRIQIPLDDSYLGIRKAFWKVSDREYKSVAEHFESKISSINNQNISQAELDIPDFSMSDSFEKHIPAEELFYDKEEWENIAREVSSAFSDYDNIMDSHVSIYFYNTLIYFHNSEQTATTYPLTYAAILITAETLSNEGERIFDHIHYYATKPNELPKKSELKKSAKYIADQLTKIQNTESFEDYYAGPVLIQEQAVSQFVTQQVFGPPNSLLAKRRPITQNEQIQTAAGQRAIGNRLELRMNRRIIDRSLSIESNPLLTEYNGTNLIGHYPVDAEGVIPKEKTLVKDGILTNFLTCRIPTRTHSQSNGSNRIAIHNKNIMQKLAPGVIHINSNEQKTEQELKDELIRIAKDEDLDYAIIIRKFEYEVSERTHASRSFNRSEDVKMTRPLYIYKVNLEDGSEELIRGAEVSGLNIRSLNRIVGVDDQQYVFNGMTSLYSNLSNKGFFHGIPVSIISPKSILFRELEIQVDDMSKRRQPVVNSPLSE